jgi:hypothetical protein
MSRSIAGDRSASAAVRAARSGTLRAAGRVLAPVRSARAALGVDDTDGDTDGDEEAGARDGDGEAKNDRAADDDAVAEVDGIADRLTGSE